MEIKSNTALAQQCFSTYGDQLALFRETPGIQFFRDDPALYLAENYPEKFVEGIDIDNIPVIDAQIIDQDENYFMCFMQDRKLNGKYRYTCFDSMNTDLAEENAIHFISKDPTEYLTENFPEKFTSWDDHNLIPVHDAQFIGTQEGDIICFLSNCNANGKCWRNCHHFDSAVFKIQQLGEGFNGVARVVVHNGLSEEEEQRLVEEAKKEERRI